MCERKLDLTALANISRISTEDFPRVSIHLQHVRMMKKNFYIFLYSYSLYISVFIFIYFCIHIYIFLYSYLHISVFIFKYFCIHMLIYFCIHIYEPALCNIKEIAQECNSREEPGQWKVYYHENILYIYYYHLVSM